MAYDDDDYDDDSDDDDYGDDDDDDADDNYSDDDYEDCCLEMLARGAIMMKMMTIMKMIMKILVLKCW